jgi:uncharacterized protein YacL
MIQAITRFALVAAGLLGGFVVTQVVDWQAQLGLSDAYVIFLFVILGGAIGYVLGGIVGRELTTGWLRIEARVAELAGIDVLLGTIGIVVGLLIAFFAAQPLRLLQPAGLAIGVSIALYVVGAYMGLSIAMTRRREVATMFPRLAPASDLAPDMRAAVLDTSAVIDGRFAELRRLGFLPGEPRVPRFVLAELQTLADSADDTRRARGRRGLDFLTALPATEAIGVFEVDYPELAGVDEKLMRLAVDAHATLVTVDYNLTKVARVRGITTLNLNEAATALRPNFLPGDVMRIHLNRPGKEAGQAVGYLEDGTMVVVAEARAEVGNDADVEVNSVLQTSAGRMIFARIADGARSRRPVNGANEPATSSSPATSSES